MLVLNNATTLPYWPDFMTSLPAIHTLSNPKKIHLQTKPTVTIIDQTTNFFCNKTVKIFTM